MKPKRAADVAVIGAGIIGLATAFAFASRGKRVVLFERTDFAVGASVRNFGLLWPVGQPEGPLHTRALRSLRIWRQILEQAGIWSNACGSLHLAYHPDEVAVLEEYMLLSNSAEYGRSILTKAEVGKRFPEVKTDSLLGALWSPTETIIDPRDAVRKIPHFLASRFGVEFRFGQLVGSVQPAIETANETWEAERVYVCSGADFETLYPEVFAKTGLRKCKLQMMRTVPQPGGWRLSTSVCAGLTLTHYESFKLCPSRKNLEERFSRTMPFYIENGIHVLVSQTESGQLTLGDSHHYGSTPEPFDSAAVDQAVLEYFGSFMRIPSLRIAERWHGIYPKLTGRADLVLQPEPGVWIVNGVGGAGMTLSFGLAEELAEA